MRTKERGGIKRRIRYGKKIKTREREGIREKETELKLDTER